MEAGQKKLLDALDGTKQFIVPIYQRTYSWTEKHCDRLWSDIVRAGNDDRVFGHFLGSIVYIEKGLYQISGVHKLLVIDGQQRLATVSLLLAALGRALEKKGQDGEISYSKIRNRFLFNSDEEGDLRYKLVLTQHDKPTLISLLDGRDLPSPASRRMADNYDSFERRVNGDGVDLLSVYRGLSKLIVVAIALERGRDNPQLIYESLNSTGLELSQADLIRNYVLMNLELPEQEALYRDYWYPMEQNFGQAQYTAHFDRFMRDYLTVRTGRIPNIRDVYEAFKAHATAGDSASTRDLVAEVFQQSTYFVKMALGKEDDKELAEAFGDINALKVDVAYPFFLELYEDYREGRVTKEEMVTIVRLVESYVFRRAVCGIPTNSLNKTFATLARELDKERYLESFMAALLLKDSYRRFPGDEEFRRELVAKDLYNFRSRNYWLRKLENHGRKERVNVQECTIEHIMPQNPELSADWRRELGNNWREIQERYLHTLGNLTLTGYNPEMSDRPFVEKRDMEGGFADSPLRLNKGLGRLERWTEVEIQRRAQGLAELALQVWPSAALPSEVLERYCGKTKTARPRVYTLESHRHLVGPVRDLFEQFRRRVLNLDSCVTEEVFKQYIAYKCGTNFVDVVPQKRRLRLALNMRSHEVHDPKGLCRDITNVSRWGNGDVEVGLSSPDQLDDVMALVRQSFERQMRDRGVWARGIPRGD